MLDLGLRAFGYVVLIKTDGRSCPCGDEYYVCDELTLIFA